jgi:DNA-binding LytR/AlgR family response regulator
MTYKAVIADDEKELRGYLKAMLAETWPELTICAEAANGREALEMIDACQPHIIFLDIKMPGLSGLDVAQKIADECQIVFVTAYNQYAVEAFEHEAIDYLVKPVTKKRLMQTIQRLKKQLQNNEVPPAGLAAVLSQVIANLPGRSNANFLRWIKTQHKEAVRLIPVEEVDYFQADDKYTLVMTVDGESLIKAASRINYCKYVLEKWCNSILRGMNHAVC